MLHHYHDHYLVLDKVNDIPDSVFYQSEEVTSSPYKIPIATLTNGPSFKSMDIPWIWPQEFHREMALYDKNYQRSEQDLARRMPEFGHYTQEDSDYHSDNYIAWQQRIPRAAYYSSYGKNRQLIFDSATARPDLIDAYWIDGYPIRYPTDPFSTDKEIPSNEIHQEDYVNDTRVGGLKSTYRLKLSDHIPYLKLKYKYVIVMAGLENLAQSGRMNHLLAHSGAVILMQTTTFEYHYSARLKPWVHYVPISYNGADVISKIEWLRDHDEMAYQIAKNAKAFGDSYLRLEDYNCYIASLHEALGDIFSHPKRSNALKPFDPVKMDMQKNWNFW